LCERDRERERELEQFSWGDPHTDTHRRIRKRDDDRWKKFSLLPADAYTWGIFSRGKDITTYFPIFIKNKDILNKISIKFLYINN